VPTYLIVILYCWAVIDVLGGGFLSYVGFQMSGESGGGLSALVRRVGYFLLCFGPGLVLCGGLTCWFTSQMKQDRIVALRRMKILLIVKEVVLWALAAFLLVSMGVRVGEWFPLLLFFTIPAAAVTSTRILLR